MSKSRSSNKNSHPNINAIAKKMFLELTRTEKKIIHQNYSSSSFRPTFTINPYARKFIQKNVNNYILFIDARVNSCYLEVREFLEVNKHKFSSFSSIGDADFIVEYAATEAVHNRFKREIYNLLKDAPKENLNEELVESFVISKTYVLKGTNNNYTEKSDYELSEDDIPKISQIQNDYSRKSIVESFGGEKKLRSFLHDIRDKQILLGYYALGEPTRPVIKAYILLLYTLNGYEHFISGNKSIKEKIVDFYSIKNDSGDDEFYSKAYFLITAEFQSISEYHTWKENLYLTSKENKQLINVMTFIVEDVISEIPIGIGNYTLFDEISKSYNSGNNNKIVFGQPYYYDELRSQYNICINLGTLKENGFIIGEPGTGKTYTAMALSKKIYDKKKRIHIVDCSGGISDKFSEVFPAQSTEIIRNVKEENFPSVNTPFPKDHNIYFYQPQKAHYCDLAINMLNQIIQMKNPDEGRITNDILIFEEAHLLFRDEKATKVIMECITISGRKGFSIWFSTQKLSHLPSALYPNLKNRIVHKIDNNEKENIAKLLLNSSEEILYDNIEKELTLLQKGQAFVSFVFPQNNIDIELSPLKIKITI